MWKILLLSLPLMLLSCTNKPLSVGDNWSEETYFKNAQLATDQSSYETALFYYREYLKRYPESPNSMAASYEIALLNKKMGNKELALSQFKEIVTAYDKENNYPDWVLILAEQFVEELGK